MICPKLDAGYCKLTKAHCPKKYRIKMVKHRMCSVFGGRKPKPPGPKAPGRRPRARRKR